MVRMRVVRVPVGMRVQRAGEHAGVYSVLSSAEFVVRAREQIMLKHTKS